MILPLGIPATTADKQIGLLPYNEPPSGWGMLFLNVSTIHTMGMKFPIDVVALTKDYKVLSVTTIYPGIKEFSPLGARHILELGPGEGALFTPGERLQIVYTESGPALAKK